jgi:hypothetical protein
MLVLSAWRYVGCEFGYTGVQTRCNVHPSLRTQFCPDEQFAAEEILAFYLFLVIA